MTATMTENPTVEAEQDTAAETQSTEPDPAVEAEDASNHDVGTLEYHFPEDLVLDEFNHRKQVNTEPDATLKASVRDIGVQEPVGARPQPDGKIGIYKGQRRWKAQLAANREFDRKGKPRRKIPVLVRHDLVGVDDDTLVLSLIENTQRVASSKRDQTEALTQLTLMDLAPSQLAKHARRLGYKPAEVKAAQRAAQLDDETLDKFSTNGWDFVELADLSEVTSLGWDAERALSEARRKDRAEKDKGRGHWEQAMARLRLNLADKVKRAELVAELEAAGVPVVRYAAWDKASQVRPLSHLVTPAGKKLTPKAHAELCPDHAAYIDDDKNRAVFACRNWSGNGHTLNAEQAAQLPVAEDKAAAKAERKRVIEGNKAWRAAREARRAFLIRLINPGKGGPKEVSDAAWSWIMLATAGSTYWFPRYYHASRRLDEVAVLLKTEVPKGTGRRDQEPFAHVVTRRGRAGRAFIMLAQVAAAFEREQMHDGVWKSPDDGAAGWLEFLAGEGYTLAECEQAIITTVNAKREEAAAKAKQNTAETEKELDKALGEAAAESGTPAEGDESDEDGGQAEDGGPKAAEEGTDDGAADEGTEETTGEASAATQDAAAVSLAA